MGRDLDPDRSSAHTADPPLIAGAVHGIRTWSMLWTRGGDVALAGFGGYEWEGGGRATRAECDAHSAGRAPDPECGCGLYALHPRAGAEGRLALEPSAAWNDRQVTGIVEAWGTVELHADGFRAEYARPVALLLLSDWEGSDYATLVHRLAGRHGARVLCIRDPAEVIAYCGRRNLGLAEGTVRSLLREPPRPEPPHARPQGVPVSAGGGAERGRLRELCEEWRPDSIGDALATLLAGVFGIFYLAFGAAIAFGIAAAVFGWFPDEDERRPAAGGDTATAGRVLHGERSLRIVDEELVSEGRRRWLYLAEVRNTGDRAAIGVVPSGRLLDRKGERLESIDRPQAVEGEANLAPGQTGVVWDVIRLRGAERRPASATARMDVEAGAARLVDGPSRAPVSVAGVRFDPELCIVTATVESRRRMLRARLLVIGRDGRERALGAGEFAVGPVSHGPRDYYVTRVPPNACLEGLPRLEAHASLTRRQLLGGRGE
ncbi:MAG: hypothetical protein ACRDL1_04530 [Solirubrobacterales bacterium]